MNKIVGALCLAIMFSFNLVYGQYSLSEFMQGDDGREGALDLGILLGPGIASTHVAESGHGDWEPGFSFAGGPFIRYTLQKTIALQADLLYTSSTSYDYPEDSYYFDEVAFKVSTLQIPLSILLSPNHKSKAASFYLGGGMFAAIPLNAEFVYDDQDYSQDVMDYFPDLLYGYNAMIGVKAMDVIAELRYSYELNGLGYDDELVPKYNNWNVRLLLGYSFF